MSFCADARYGETLWRVSWQLLAVLVFGLPLWVVAVYLV